MESPIGNAKSAWRLESRDLLLAEDRRREGRFWVLIRITAGQDSFAMSTLDLRCLMAQPNSGIGNVTTNAGLVEIAMAYSRSRVLCAAARLGVADALGNDVRTPDVISPAAS